MSVLLLLLLLSVWHTPADTYAATSVLNQSINIRVLRRDKMQANNSKQKGNAVSKKKH